MKAQILLIVLILAVGCTSADSWSGYASTNSTSWSIFRESTNVNFYYEQHVSGKVGPVDGRNNRSLNSYYSCFSNVNINDVSIRERLAASKGKFKADEIEVMAARNDNLILSDIAKPAGSNEYTVNFHESWPVVMVQRKSIAYSGKGINARELAGNNLDYAKVDFLYSNSLIKDITIRMGLSKLNATVIATDNAIETAKLEATRSTEFKVRASVAGLSDLSYLQSGPKYTGEPLTNYEVLNKGDIRHYGKYNMTNVIKMISFENNSEPDEGWLSCCEGGWENMVPLDKIGYGIGDKNVFNYF